jgi:phage baseplate assembly protein W
MRGLASSTGKALSGREHLIQSIRDIVTTRIGSRVGTRSYGAGLLDLVDRPMNAETVADLTQTIAEAFSQTIRGAPVEPRFKLQRVRVNAATPGEIIITISGLYLPEGSVIEADVRLNS